MFSFDETARLIAAIERGAHREEQVGMNACLTCQHCGASVCWSEAARRIVHADDCAMRLVDRFHQRRAEMECHPEGSLASFLAKLRFDGLCESHLEEIAHAVADGRGEPVDRIENVEIEGDLVCATWRNRYGDDSGSFEFPATWLMNGAHVAGMEAERRAQEETEERERQEAQRQAEEHDRAEFERLKAKFATPT